MMDYRMITFVKLCDTMNYRKTAEELNITQPGVTQHIQYLEKEYGCKLFSYNNRVLKKTANGEILEQYARGEIYNEYKLRKALGKVDKVELRIGATKTIGDYVLCNTITELADDPKMNISLYLDNTERLLKKLDENRIDLAVIEGFFDKVRYGHQLFRREPFVGVCSLEHPFSGTTVSMEQLFTETILIREEGSGTRAILEQLLGSYSYSLGHFERMVCLSSFGLIKECLVQNKCITFAYKAFADSSDRLGTFTIDGLEIDREFNFVYLKNSDARGLIDYLL
ncbi:DNA-binding transcriptional regulator, LysR family [Dethiosulfatibacter aminovorans DSM 17477]|uniref:DNA-binding transcriptional regulator, LysR family n=1 Tax=Dethiosulfatibacter aminovorans DSM 17477 TaxID=1121476 RepID=A0A1M6GTA3_9FIRM|nr:LysR family transcriptional regulator [Dethiosulfatibacter aminovorans]SHJ13079.1 DNA-binding transcriptional regulator, LysR family [Dethiosulfatibacter aminovorans DSM 17477]